MSKAGTAPKPGIPLAMPPLGSGLKPVMGDPGPPVIGYTFKFLRDPLAVAIRATG